MSVKSKTAKLKPSSQSKSSVMIVSKYFPVSIRTLTFIAATSKAPSVG